MNDLKLDQKRETIKERAISCKTLICFLQSLINEVCDLELKNDIQMTGRIVLVDAGMNVELKDVTVRKPKNISLREFSVEQFDYLYLKGEKIRYVQFSDQIDVEQNIQNQLNQYQRKGEQVEKNRDIHHKQKKQEEEKRLLSKFANR